MKRIPIRVAADIGGTFTDIAVILEDGAIRTRKIPSTPHDYADAVVRGVGELVTAIGREMSDVAAVLHGCTIATNAIVEGKGARTALITTRGFRDVLEIRRIRVPRLYDPLYVRPKPLVPRELRFEVTERVGPQGEIVTPLDGADLDRVIAEIRRQRVEAVAVTFLHSYANPSHERIVGEALKQALPGCFISLSVDVLPEIREYERTSTTAINSYIGPPVRTYIHSLSRQLQEAGITGPLQVMQSGGGILDVEIVLERPAEIVECGPAAGVIASAHIARNLEEPNVITFDMGGTTAKASIIENGKLLRTGDYEVGGGISLSNTLIKGAGYALKLPVIDISEVGAGGGSIVWLDKAGVLKVGPESAGAVPGPACYAAGGSMATVTDANVVLGYLNQQNLAGGSVPIDAAAARRALQSHVADPLGIDLVEAAHGVYTVTTANMMRAIKTVSTHRGRDPRDFAMMAFGGNGGIFAVELARALQMRTVVIPPNAGVFSAVGLLVSDLEASAGRAFLRLTHEVDPGEVEDLFAELKAIVLTRLGAPSEQVRFKRLALVRYFGQAFELEIPFAPGETLASLRETFEMEHLRTFGHRFAGDMPAQFVGLRVIGSCTPAGQRRISASLIGGAEKSPVTRRAYFGPDHGWADTPVLARENLPQQPRPGPMIIEEYEGTTVVGPASAASRDASGNVVIQVQA